MRFQFLEQTAGIRLSLNRGQLQPFEGLDTVGRNTHAEEITLADVKLSEGIAALGGQLLPFGCVGLTSNNTTTLLIEISQIVLAGDATLLRRQPVKSRGFGQVEWHAHAGLGQFA